LVQAQFPKPGIYYLNIFGHHRKSSERNIFIMQYKVLANISAGETAGFVKPYPKFAVPAPGTFALNIAAGQEKGDEKVIQVEPILKYEEVQRAQ
jgi:hypothetical protein